MSSYSSRIVSPCWQMPGDMHTRRIDPELVDAVIKLNGDEGRIAIEVRHGLADEAWSRDITDGASLRLAT